MTITLIQSAANLDPNDTATDPAQSLTNYIAAVTEAIRAEYPAAEVEHNDSDSVTYAWTLSGYDAGDRAQVEDRIQSITEAVYDAGTFWA